MARALALILLQGLVAPAACLKCKSCHGEFGCSVETEVTCREGESSCRTAVRSAAVSPEPATPNQLSCHACTSQGAWCPPSARTQLGCTGAQDQCLDLDITGTLGEFTNMKLKGCASLPRCQDGLGFYAGTRAIHARCCDTPLCNHLDTDFLIEGEPHNGLQCFSCVDEDGVGCTSNSSSTVPCMGPHNMCLEGIGRSRTGGADSGLVTFKGCATPAMCQSSLLALVQELDEAEVYCCTGSLCNTRIMDGRVAEGRPSHPSPTGPVTRLPPAPTPEPDCILEKDEEEEDVVPVAGGHPPLAGSHGDREAETTKSSEGRGLEEGGAFAAGDHAVVPTGGPGATPHPDHVATGSHGTASAEDRDTAFSAGGVFSESNAPRPTGVPPPDPVATGVPAAVVLEGSSRSEPGVTETPENTREIPAGAGLAHAEEEEEECEEETNYSARDHITGEASASASSTESPRLDHGDGPTEASSLIRATTGLGARVFVAERDGHSSADSPSGAGSTTVSPGDGVVAEGAGHGATSSPSLFAADSSGTESRTGSARESFVAEGSTTWAPDSSAAASGEARSTDSPTPGSPGNRIDAVARIPYLATRQNESVFSEDKEGGSSQPSAPAASPTSTVLAPGGASAGSHRGKNKTLCTKRPGVALVDHGLSSHDMPAQAGHAAPPSAPATVSKPEGSLERTEGDRDRPTISFPITVETPNNSPRGPLGNASAPGLDPVEGLVKNSSGGLYTNTPGKPRPPYPSGASGLGSNLGLVSLTLLLAVLLH
nr:collagen alpha-1(I) chain-like isoform X2 [Caretta caretta]